MPVLCASETCKLPISANPAIIISSNVKLHTVALDDHVPSPLRDVRNVAGIHVRIGARD